MLLHIKEKYSVKGDSIETILPGVLRKMGHTNNTIKEVQHTLMEHQKTTSIKGIGKTVEKKVDIVISKNLNNFVVHIGKYNEDKSDTRENNSIILHTTNNNTNTNPHVLSNMQHNINMSNQ